MRYKNKLQINHYFHLNYRKLQPIPVNIHSSIDYTCNSVNFTRNHNESVSICEEKVVVGEKGFYIA